MCVRLCNTTTNDFLNKMADIFFYSIQRNNFYLYFIFFTVLYKMHIIWIDSILIQETAQKLKLKQREQSKWTTHSLHPIFLFLFCAARFSTKGLPKIETLKKRIISPMIWRFYFSYYLCSKKFEYFFFRKCLKLKVC